MRKCSTPAKLLTAVAGTALGVPAAHAQLDAAIIGHTDLVARLGAANVPTGAGVAVGQVEASETAPPTLNYGPNQSNPEFGGKSFTAMSGASGNSGHATLVAQIAYGNSSSVAPGISSIFLYEAGHWATAGFLRTGSGAASAPLPPPTGLKIFNNSWGGSFGNAAMDNEAVRRADFQADRDDVLMINPTLNNIQADAPLMSASYNGITVGLMSGTHLQGPSPTGVDGPGRQRPLIVTPGQFTSFGAPYVESTAALLVQTARTAAGLSSNANAQRSETLKAVLLAGGRHRDGWTNNTPTSGANRGITTTPLDPAYGVDVVNVDNSHLILTGLEQNGSTTPPTAPNISGRGWDFATLVPGASLNYRFTINGVSDRVSVVCTWHRMVNSTFNGFTMADLNVQLFKLGCNGQPNSITGTAGVNVYGGGNVLSQSSIDNVEHLFIRNLQPGDYMLRVSRVDATAAVWEFAVAWLIPTPTPAAISGDVTGNGVTNVDDLLAVINAWGACASTCPADVAPAGGNCVVNVDDLLGVINDWG